MSKYVEREAELRRLKTSQSDIPVLGYKKCFFNTGHPEPFASMNGRMGYNGHYGVVEKSICSPWDRVDHPVDFNPYGHRDFEILCECGFYAFKDPEPLFERDFSFYRRYYSGREDIQLDYPVANLLVELYGTVVVYEEGYRASHQRVLKMGLDKADYRTQLLLQKRPDLARELEDELGIPVTTEGL